MITIRPFAVDDVHVWTGVNQMIMVSHENIKTLRTFTSIDNAINSLYLSGHKAAARELHNQNEAMK